MALSASTAWWLMAKRDAGETVVTRNDLSYSEKVMRILEVV